MAAPAAGFVAELRRRIHRYLHACLVGGHVPSQIVDSKSLLQSCLRCSACLDEFLVARAVQLPIRRAGQLSLCAMIFLRRIDTELCGRFGRLLLTQHGAIVSEAGTCRIQETLHEALGAVYAQSVVWEAEFLLAAGCMIDMDESIWSQSNN